MISTDNMIYSWGVKVWSTLMIWLMGEVHQIIAALQFRGMEKWYERRNWFNQSDSFPDTNAGDDGGWDDYDLGWEAPGAIRTWIRSVIGNIIVHTTKDSISTYWMRLKWPSRACFASKYCVELCPTFSRIAITYVWSGRGRRWRWARDVVVLGRVLFRRGGSGEEST